MGAYPIEKGVPLPPGPKRGGRPIVFDLDNMEVGDSFYVPHAVTGDVTPCIASRNKARKWDRTFTVRQQENGVRCWRIE